MTQPEYKEPTHTYVLDERLRRYAQFRADIANDEVEDAVWCSRNGVSLPTLQDLKFKQPEWAWEVLKQRRSRYIVELMAIDEGLFRKAKAGDQPRARSASGLSTFLKEK